MIMPNMKQKMPPIIGCGMVRNMVLNFPKSPNMTIMMPAHGITLLLATLVTPIVPIFAL